MSMKIRNRAMIILTAIIQHNAVFVGKIITVALNLVII